MLTYKKHLVISWYEGLLVDCIPMVPDRLSYSEMADQEFKYPSIWTKNFDQYKKFKGDLVDRITGLHGKTMMIIRFQWTNNYTI